MQAPTFPSLFVFVLFGHAMLLHTPLGPQPKILNPECCSAALIGGPENPWIRGKELGGGGGARTCFNSHSDGGGSPLDALPPCPLSSSAIEKLGFGNSF